MKIAITNKTGLAVPYLLWPHVGDPSPKLLEPNMTLEDFVEVKINFLTQKIVLEKFTSEFGTEKVIFSYDKNLVINIYDETDEGDPYKVKPAVQHGRYKSPNREGDRV